MRQLATIQKIKKIEPIEGADRIVKATVLGWHVVVGKNEFREGELVVYCEIDSVFPDWLKKKIGFTDKFLKTRRFKGVYSQGFCLPLSILQDVNVKKPVAMEEGKDVTENLGIIKYEPDMRNSNEWWKCRDKVQYPKNWFMRFKICRHIWKKLFYKPAYGIFPTDLIPKTDETRVQVLTDVLGEYKDTKCQYTEKIDGSSITFWKDKKLHVCSRNREIYIHDDFMYATAAELEDKLEKGYIYQGEIIGPNIQGNKYGVDDYHILVYQMFDPKKKEYLAPKDLQHHLGMAGIEQVPVLGELSIVDDVDTLVEIAEGPSVLSIRQKDTQREGIVIRPLENIDGLHDQRFVGGRLSFKVINPKFLVKYNL